MMAGLWRIAGRNLLRNTRRNIATGTAIALGFAALVALGGFMNRLQNYLRVLTIYTSHVGHITIYKEGGLERSSTKPKLFTLNASDLAILGDIAAHDSAVEMHGAQLYGTGLIGNGCKAVPFIATGIDPHLDDLLRNHSEVHRWLPDLKALTSGQTIAHYPEDLGALTVGEGLAKVLSKTKVHDDIAQGPVVVQDCQAKNIKDLMAHDANVQLLTGTWTGMTSAYDGEIVGIYDTGLADTNYASLTTSLTYLQKLYDTDHATLYSVWLHDHHLVTEQIEYFKAQAAAKGLNIDLYPWNSEDAAPLYSGTIQFVFVMVVFILVVLATVVMLSIFNSATMTVIERSQEIGMMRALGYTKKRIRTLFVAETLLLSSVAVVAGGIAVSLFTFAVNRARIEFNPPGVIRNYLELVPNSTIVGLSCLTILLLVTLTTLIAVKNVAGRNIASLLVGTQR